MKKMNLEEIVFQSGNFNNDGIFIFGNIIQVRVMAVDYSFIGGIEVTAYSHLRETY